MAQISLKELVEYVDKQRFRSDIDGKVMGDLVDKIFELQTRLGTRAQDLARLTQETSNKAQQQQGRIEKLEAENAALRDLVARAGVLEKA